MSKYLTAARALSGVDLLALKADPLANVGAVDFPCELLHNLKAKRIWRKTAKPCLDKRKEANMKPWSAKLNLLVVCALLAVWTVGYRQCAAATPSQEREKMNKRVIVIGVDGMGSRNVWRGLEDEVAPPAIPNLERLRSQGLWTLDAQIDPLNFSGPNWVGIVSGVSSLRHGVVSNDCERGNEISTIYKVVRQQMNHARIGVVHEWGKIACHFEKDTVDHVVKTHNAKETTAEVIKYLEASAPDFLFVHFDEIDGAGHAHGANSSAYVAAVEKLDEAVGNILTAIEALGLADSTYLLLTADHGHAPQGGRHASSSEPVPLIIVGPGIRSSELKGLIRNNQVAPFAAYLLGLDPAADWESTADPLPQYFNHNL